MTMRNLAMAMALASTALATPALARDDSWYIGAEIGPNLVQNSLFDLRRPGTTTIVDNGLRQRYNIGFDVGGVVGYDFGLLRTEFEVAYKQNSVDRIIVEQSVPAVNLGSGVGIPAIINFTNASGNARALSFMANALFDFGGKDRDVGAYIGAGAGIARVQYSNNRFVGTGAAWLNDSDTNFAYQLLAGIYKPVSDHIDLGIKYRFFNVSNVGTFTTNGVETTSRYRSHSLLATLTYNFFTAEPAPPPPPPAPPPAPPAPAPLPPCPPAAVTPGPFLVFFDWDRSAITAEAASILDRAAEQFAATGQTSVQLAGHADKSGKDDYNVALSQRRADAVKAYLATKGVPDSAIATEAFGEARPLVDTADGVREPQNRRVEITFSGAPAAPQTNCAPQ